MKLARSALTFLHASIVDSSASWLMCPGVGASFDSLSTCAASSASTRVVLAKPLQNPSPISWRRGSRYGTSICDLQRHRRLDLLPERDAKSAAAWLARYPSIEIISRDRGGEYAEAAHVGAPQAVQIADRFHLSQNLHDAVDQAIRRRFSEIHRLLATVQDVVLGEDLPLKRDDATK